MNDNLERLLWQRKDGELAASDRAELESLLSEGASTDEREIESIARLLSRVRVADEEVPAELRSRVMAQVQARSASRGRSARLVKSNRGTLETGVSFLVDAFKKESFMSRKRLALLGSVAVVVVAGVAVLVLSEDFPPSSKVTGAIGGVEKAERYRDAQVKAEDVKIYDADGFDQDGYDRNDLDRDGNSRLDVRASQGGGSVLYHSQGGGALSLQDKGKSAGGGSIANSAGGGSIANSAGGGTLNDKGKSAGGGSIANSAGGGAVQSTKP